MADDTHPAIAVPAQALASGVFLAAPAVALANGKKAVKSGTKTNPLTLRLHALYPGGEMNLVEVRDFRKNPNPMIRKMSASLGAWTNSSKLIYYNMAVEPYLRDYVLYHESMHVLQFQRNGNTYPSSFAKMLEFELAAYPSTEAWVKSDAGKALWKTKAVHAKAVRQAEQATAGARAIRDLARATIAAGQGSGAMDPDEIYLRTFIDDDSLPPLGFKNGVEQVYQVDDLYYQDKVKYGPRWKELGY